MYGFLYITVAALRLNYTAFTHTTGILYLKNQMSNLKDFSFTM